MIHKSQEEDTGKLAGLSYASVCLGIPAHIHYTCLFTTYGTNVSALHFHQHLLRKAFAYVSPARASHPGYIRASRSADTNDDHENQGSDTKLGTKPSPSQ